MTPLGTTVAFAMPERDAPFSLSVTDVLGRESVHRGFLSGGQWSCPVRFSTPGLCTLRLTWKSGLEVESSPPSFLLVQPPWLEEARLLTVIPRSLGTVDTWLEQLRAQAALGYNVIHFAPVQLQNQYKSHYGLVNHLELNPNLFPGTEADRKLALKQVVDGLKTDLGVKCVQDIVLNHASAACPLFEQQSDSAFTQENTPYLAPAVELDLALQRLSREIARKSAEEWYPYGNEVSSEVHIDAAVNHITKAIVPDLHLEEYFLLEEKKEIERIFEVGGKAKRATVTKFDLKEVQQCVVGTGVRRWGTNVRRTQIDKSLLAACVAVETISKADATAIVTGVNAKLKKAWERVVEEIGKNVRAAIYHLKIAENNTEVTLESPLLKPYFVLLPTGEYAALNGFVMDDADVRLDIIRESAHNYLRRSVFPWRDCVKLRYCAQPSDNPALWQYMETYVRYVAATFDGIRVDNAHGTPMHVLRYMAHAAKQQNPSVAILAEICAPTKSQEKDFMSCGIDLIIRESVHSRSAQSLGELIRKESKPALSTIPRAHINLPIEPVPCILFDCTHDSETFPVQHALPRAAAIAFSRCAIGSTRGYDDLLKARVSVVGERRKYPPACNSAINKFPNTDSGTEVVLTYRTTETVWNVQVKGSWNNWTSGLLLE